MFVDFFSLVLLVVSLAGCLAGWLVGWWLVGRSVGWLLVDCLSSQRDFFECLRLYDICQVSANSQVYRSGLLRAKSQAIKNHCRNH